MDESSESRPIVQLPNDGAAFGILRSVVAALTAAGASPQEIETYIQYATSGDYAHLLAVTFARVHVV